MKRILALFFSLFITGVLCAQSNEFVDELLASTTVNAGQAAFLVLVASDNLGEDADPARSFELLESLGWAPKNKTAESPLTIAEYSFMLMRAFGLKGGILYTFFPSPRYAYRELASKVVVQGRTDPADSFNGNTAIRMLGRIFDIKGVAQ